MIWRKMMINGEDYYDYVMEQLYEEGQELGLEGQELLDWVDDQFEQRGV